MSIVILSPHLDDAVFSCWHLLSGPDTTVITIFAGIPAEGTKTVWDRVCGNADSAQMMRDRRQENDATLKEAGVSFVNLDFLDGQYQSSKRNIAEIANAVVAQVGNDTTFYAPLAASRVWRHPDHVAVREVGKYLQRQGKTVAYYADIPYMQMPIRPTRGFIRQLNKRACKLIGMQLSAEVTEFDVQAQARKRNAMRQYGSQYTMTNFTALGTLGRKVNVQREVTLHANV